MLSHYFPILLFISIGLVIGVLPILLGALLGPRKPYEQKNSPYECGFEAFEDARMPFDVRFYLIAILFIIFDLETAFIFPWAVQIKYLMWPGLVAMAVFLGLLTIGFAYEWKKGALEWE